VRFPKRRLVLFFVAQALAVATMISIAMTKRGGPSAVSVILSMLLVLGELGLVASVLRFYEPVWRSVLGLGLVFLIAAMISAFFMGMELTLWHVVLGLLLCGAGSAAGVCDLLTRLRRPDDSLPEDKISSGMWPLD
jgi:hypothetical protein